MTETSCDHSALSRAAALPRLRRDSIFFGAMAAWLAVTVFVGFAPTFYLRSHSGDLPTLSPLLTMHGLLFSAWMLLYPAQTALVAAGRMRWHRQIGIAGAVLAASMVLLGTAVQIAHTRRLVLDGSYANNSLVEDLGLSLGLLDILVFLAFVSTAIWCRRRPAQHKRLILLATLALIGPAVVKIPGITAFPPLAVVLSPLIPVIPLMFYDLLSCRKILPVTLWGVGISIGYHILAVALVGVGAAGALARWIAAS
ncbi:MAG: hypothetical protein WDO56_30610 [Gammaproteobacteria bacterium]